MTPRSKKTKLKRLNNQFNKLNGSPKRQSNLLLRIQTLENTQRKR